MKRRINPADDAPRFGVRRLSLCCRSGKFHHVRGRTLVLGCDNCIDQYVQGGASRAARLVIAAQIMAGSFKMEVGGGKVAGHEFSFFARRATSMAHFDLPKGEHPQLDLNQIDQLTRSSASRGDLAAADMC
ncbi:hypothetical protein [Mesorhizobium sp. L-2-11]|uniref:hypothetical protein n=1 Tax=Mesorhizobium sp. L-2-11 TaxID=2744521 RepID=UPI0019292109